MTEPRDIFRLQQLETELAGKRSRLQEVEAELKNSAAVQEARVALEGGEQQLQKKVAQQRDLELEFKSLSQKAANAEKRLYSGVVSNPKELADLQAEVSSLARRRESLEERLLEAMIEREEAESVLAGARTVLQAAEDDWSTQQSSLSVEQGELRSDLAELGKERADLLPGIDDEDLAAFRSLWNRKGGVAVVRVESGTCGGCGVSISPKMEWQLRQGELACCSNCDRILVRI
jgi:predicted  nucleic acid-binding Zn-ribbon protein